MGVAAEQGRTLEAAEAEINRYIERQAEKNGAACAREELWKVTANQYRERQRRQNRWEWVRYFDRMADSHEQLSLSYRERADKLCEEGD